LSDDTLIDSYHGIENSDVLLLNSYSHLLCVVPGGFALVFVVRSARSDERFALKRLCVNSEQDLDVARREIHIAVSYLYFYFTTV